MLKKEVYFVNYQCFKWLLLDVWLHFLLTLRGTTETIQKSDHTCIFFLSVLLFKSLSVLLNGEKV